MCVLSRSDDDSAQLNQLLAGLERRLTILFDAAWRAGNSAAAGTSDHTASAAADAARQEAHGLAERIAERALRERSRFAA